MTVTMRSLKAGDVVRARFHGSKQFGNEPHELELEVVSVDLEPGAEHVTFKNGMEFDVQKLGGRWVYGTSSERFSIVEKLKTIAPDHVDNLRKELENIDETIIKGQEQWT